jgi:hypothetical protein
LFWCKDMSACVIYSTQFQEVGIRSITISDSVASVNGRVMEGERHGMCESVFKTAWERHGMCESALNVPTVHFQDGFHCTRQ